MEPLPRGLRLRSPAVRGRRTAAGSGSVVVCGGMEEANPVCVRFCFLCCACGSFNLLCRVCVWIGSYMKKKKKEQSVFFLQII